MDSKHLLITLFVVVCYAVYQSNALQCYVCTSANTPGCGVTWEVPKKNQSSLLKKCDGPNAACRKLVTTDTHMRNEVVMRECWNLQNATAELSDDFFTCTDLAKKGTSCYCKKDLNDDEPCNGQSPLFNGWQFISGLVVAVLSVVRVTY